MSQEDSGASRRDFFGAAAGIAAIAATAVTPGAASAAAPAAPSSQGDKLRALLRGKDPLPAPIVYDVASAKLAQFMGFKVITIGGSATSSGMYGMGDYGMATISELVELAVRMAQALDVPLIADADDGGGNPMNVYRAMKRYAKGGVACVLLEDLTGAKHVPGRPEGQMVPQAVHADKIKAALDAGGAGGPLVLARSDGLGKGESFDQVLARVKAYSDAGAEMIFVSGASLEQKKKISEVTAKPLFSTGGPATVTEEAAVGVKVPAFAIEPYALGASHAAMSALLKDGKIAGLPTVPREASLAIADAKMWAEIHQKYNADKA
ncbi:MAG: isocitrate lyase/PEP mutase family protein [Proteobacteria bacterium]|nr:isocitrate lyase/PEP mutase family protein [Pseudomonadota bacterium]